LKRRNVIPGFELSPVVVRRSAVEIFWQIPNEERQDFFWDYLKLPFSNYRSSADEDVLAEHATAVRVLKKATQRIRTVLPTNFKFRNQAYPYALPTHTSGLATLVKAASESKKDRGLGSLDGTDKGIIAEYERALRVEEGLRQRAETARSKAPKDLTRMRDILVAIGPRVALDYKTVAGESWIEDLTFTFTHNGMLDIALKRANGPSLRPEEVLSEAHLDLLALLILVEVHIECANLGQRKVLVLDDVFQSIDAPLRSTALTYLSRLLKDWQLIITLHDRLWLMLAKRCLIENEAPPKVLELRGHGFGTTPTVMGTGTSHLRDLHHALESNAAAVAVVGVAGRAMEALCNELSMLLGTSVHRKEDDKYTIGDLWPNLQKAFESCDDPGVAAIGHLVTRSQFLRNLVGAHHSTWADNLSDAEALESARNIQLLYEKFWCPTCERVAKVARASGKWTLTFTCGHH
jgi:hypothetical protein